MPAILLLHKDNNDGTGNAMAAGQGIELGRGAHNPLAPADCISVAPCDGVRYVDERDLIDYQVYAAEQQRHGRGVDQVDVVAEASDLPFADGELDYVASSHVLEHLPDIFSAWLEWWRVLRPGGISFMIVPKRDAWWKTACGRLPR
jgi:SAM-dependent methyltransferase